MDPVVHFEMPYEDKKRITDFYTAAFGWSAQMMGPDMGEYVLVTTTPTDEKTQTPLKPGSINGGFFKQSTDSKPQSSSVVIAVQDIRQSVEKVKAAGGKVLGEPMNIPGIGLYVSFVDTEGNRASLLQPEGGM